MPRMRTLKPEFFSDPDVCALSPLAAILYEGLWCHADRDGRLEDKPRDLALKILPMRQCDVNVLLDELAQHKEGRDYGFVLRYQSAGRRYLQLWKLGEHQHFHHKEESRGLPPPPRDAWPGFMTPGQPRVGPSSEELEPQVSLGSASDQPRVNPSGAGTGTGTGTDKRRAPAASPPGHPSENSDSSHPRPTPALPYVGPSLTLGPPEAHPATPRPASVKPPKPPADPRHASVRAALEAAFLELRGDAYDWQGEKDGPALKHLLAIASDAEITARWARGLALGDVWPGCSTVAQLRSKWNDLTASGRAKPSAPTLRPQEPTACELCGTEAECGAGLCYARCAGLYAAAIEAGEITYEQRAEWLARQKQPPPEPEPSPLEAVPKIQKLDFSPEKKQARKQAGALGRDPFDGLAGAKRGRL